MITAGELRQALSGELESTAADELAERVRARVGAEALAKHRAQLVDELDVAWVVEAACAPDVVAEVGDDVRIPTRPLGDSGLFAAAARWSHGTAVRWRYELDGQRLGGGQTETYLTHPDSRERPGVPKGTLLPQPPWRSQVFPGTVRDWSRTSAATSHAASPPRSGPASAAPPTDLTSPPRWPGSGARRHSP